MSALTEINTDELREYILAESEDFPEDQDYKFWDENTERNKSLPHNKNKVEYKYSPDVIINLNDEGLNKVKIAEGVAEYLGLCKNEKVLLKYYAECSTGYHPSLRAIQNDTGIAEREIMKAKISLIEKNVIQRQAPDEMYPVDSRDKVSQYNKYDIRLIFKWNELGSIAYSQECYPESNDCHRYTNAEGKRVRQHKKKYLGKEKTVLLWNNLPAEYWATIAMRIYKTKHKELADCYGCDGDCETCEKYPDKLSQYNKY